MHPIDPQSDLSHSHRHPNFQQVRLRRTMTVRTRWATMPILLLLTLLIGFLPHSPALLVNFFAHQPTATMTSSRYTFREQQAEPPPITVRWFMRWDDERIRDIAVPLLGDFRAAQPTINVALENVTSSSDYYRQLQLQLESNTAPDLLYLATHVAYQLNREGALLPLDPLIRGDGLNLQEYDPALLDLYRNELGQLYCLPVDIATMAVLYNRTLFANAGLLYPTERWSWDELLASAKALTVDANGDGRPEQYGIDRFDNYWPLLVWSWSGHNVFDNPRQPTAFLLEEEKSVDALQWLADLALVEKVMPPINTATRTEDHLRSGTAAMAIGGHWQLAGYLAAGLDIDIAPLPSGEYTVNRSDGSCLAITRQSQVPTEAWRLLRYLVGTEGIGARLVHAQDPAKPLISALYTHSFIINPFAEPLPVDEESAPIAWPDAGSTLRFSLYDPLHPMYMVWQPSADKELQALWRGQRDADTAVGRMANRAEDLLEDLAPEDDASTAASNLTVVDRSAQGAKTAGPATHSAPSTTDFAVIATIASSAGITNIGTTTSTTASVSATGLPTPQQNVPLLSSDGAPTVNGESGARSWLALPRHYFVDPTGDDTNSGLHSSIPLATIQHALDIVQPGDTIHLAAGDYYENITSVTAGRLGAPITIMGPTDAIIHGNGANSAAFYLTHDYYTLTGFTIDGLYGDPDTKDGYTQKLLYVQGTGEQQGVTGLRVLQMNFRNAGGECVRLRYFAQHNEIAYSTFRTCGLLDFVFEDGGKNGEGIYIGTASNQWNDGKNPTAGPDGSAHNWIHHNTIDTQGNECVEVKEGGYANLIEYNLCTGQLDPDSAGIGVRGNQNIIRFNTIYNTVGAGIRLGGHEVDSTQYGVENAVYGNYLFENITGGVKIINGPQMIICGNHFPSDSGKRALGESSEHYDPAAPC